MELKHPDAPEITFKLSLILDDIFTAKSSFDRFLIIKDYQMIKVYEKIGKEINPKNIVEIGILHGGSYAYLSLLYKPTFFLGIDKHLDRCETLFKFLENKDKQVYQICQIEKSEDVERVVPKDIAYDLIIDDSSHTRADVEYYFKTLFPLVRNGGAYIIEDWGWEFFRTKFWQDYYKEHGRNSPMPFIYGLLKNLARSEIRAMEFTPYMCVVYKS